MSKRRATATGKATDLATDAGPPIVRAHVAAGGDVGYCQQRYRSYDPASGTYLGYDGLRHPC